MANPTPALLPCPFCGASARGYEIEPHQHSAALLALVPNMPKEHQGSYVIEGDCQCGSGLIGDNQAEVTARWNTRAPQAVAAQAAPAAVAVPDERAAYEMGAKGAEPTEHERILFEEWMRGHCWKVVGTWDGKTYRGDAERGLFIDPHAMRTRQLWAVWRDRAALAATPALPTTEDSSAGNQPTDADIVALFGDTKFSSITAVREALRRWGTKEKVQAEPVAFSDEDMTQLITVKESLKRIASGMTVTSSDRMFDSSIRPRKMTIRDAMEIAQPQAGIIEKLIARLYTAPQAQPADAPIAYLQEADQHLLHRFIETTEDDESFDIGKDAVKRLANLGVVENCGFGRYGVTMFGYWVHEHFWHQNPSLPLKTNADRDLERRAAMAATKEGGAA